VPAEVHDKACRRTGKWLNVSPADQELADVRRVVQSAGDEFPRRPAHGADILAFANRSRATWSFGRDHALDHRVQEYSLMILHVTSPLTDAAAIWSGGEID
jgi:hypothetical protein